MTLAPGTVVTVLSLNRRGEIEACVRPGVYRVRLGAVTTVVRETDLKPSDTTKKRSGTQRSAQPAGADIQQPDASVSQSLDLHGLTVDEARNRVAAYISRAILAGHERVEIIHGIGTGRLKAAVTADLRQIAAVRRVSPHPDNPGIVIAYL